MVSWNVGVHELTVGELVAVEVVDLGDRAAGVVVVAAGDFSIR